MTVQGSLDTVPLGTLTTQLCAVLGGGGRGEGGTGGRVMQVLVLTHMMFDRDSDGGFVFQAVAMVLRLQALLPIMSAPAQVC